MDRGVIVEVIAADVGHASGVETDARHARLAQGMTGHFHYRMGAAVGGRTCEPGGQLSGGRRGPGGRLECVAVEVAEGARHAHLMPGAGENARQQAHGRRLAVGAGDADELEAMAGIAGQGLANPPIGISGVGRHAIGQAELWRRPLGKHGVAAASDRLGDELMAIAAAARQCGKEHSRPHHAANRTRRH